MRALGAVQPHWRSVVHHNRICGCHLIGGLDGHVARVDARYVLHDVGDGHAWGVEGGLRDGVVHGRELELHHVSNLCLDVVGCEGLGAVHAADFDDVDGCVLCWENVSFVRVF